MMIFVGALANVGRFTVSPLRDLLVRGTEFYLFTWPSCRRNGMLTLWNVRLALTEFRRHRRPGHKGVAQFVTVLLSGRGVLWLSLILPVAVVVAAPLVACTSVEAERIVFRTARDDDWNIYVMSPDGNDHRPLTTGGAVEATPALSPDGTRIAFARTVPSANPDSDIYVMNSDGSDVKRLTDDSSQESFPTWSPGGLRIAFQAGEAGGGFFPSPIDRRARLYTVRAGGSNRARLTDNDAAEATPDWSPDGRRITFASNLDGDWDIYVIRIDGVDQKRLTDSSSEDILPIWSPDGTRIAFVSDRGGSREIYVMRQDGAETERLTLGSGIIEWSGLSWSPDGLFIAYGATRDGQTDIYAISIADGTETRLTKASGIDTHPSWGPAHRVRSPETLEP